MYDIPASYSLVILSCIVTLSTSSNILDVFFIDDSYTLLQIPSVTLYGNVVWFPDQFLSQHLSHLSKKLIDKKAQEAVVTARVNYIQISSNNLTKLISTFSFQVSNYFFIKNFLISIKDHTKSHFWKKKRAVVSVKYKIN